MCVYSDNAPLDLCYLFSLYYWYVIIFDHNSNGYLIGWCFFNSVFKLVRLWVEINTVKYYALDSIILIFRHHIRKSRYDSIDSYLSQSSKPFNDLKLEINQPALKKLLENGKLMIFVFSYSCSYLFSIHSIIEIGLLSRSNQVLELLFHHINSISMT